MNDVPIGTEMIVKESNEKGVLKEITPFPTTFTVYLENGETQHFLTHDVDIIGWPPSE